MKKILFFCSLIAGFLMLVLFRKDEELSIGTSKEVQQKKEKSSPINSRQNILLALLKQHKSLQMKDIEKRIQTVNVRTLRRDLDKLQKLGLISKTGSTKAAVYGVRK